MILTLLKAWFGRKPEEVALDAEYISCREELRLAGLREEDLRNMEPDARVALLDRPGWILMTIFILPADLGSPVISATKLPGRRTPGESADNIPGPPGS